MYPLPYDTSLSKDYDGYYYALSGGGVSHHPSQNIPNDLDYVSAPPSPRMFVSPTTDSSVRCYSVEDPLAIPHFDSAMIDLSNPSEIFQFEKGEVACGGSYDIPTHHGFPDSTGYSQSSMSGYDLNNMRSRLEFSYAQ